MSHNDLIPNPLNGSSKNLDIKIKLSDIPLRFRNK